MKKTIALAVFLVVFVPAFLSEAAYLESTPQATVLFGGDMMFDRSIRTVSEAKGGDYLFDCLDPLLIHQDLVVANLEGPITDNASISQNSAPGDGNNFTFTFPETTAGLLFAHNIRMVNLGNNHIENFGSAGVQSTDDALTHATIGFFGDPPAQTVAETVLNGVRFAFINYNQFAPSSTASTTIAQIHAAVARHELPIVYTHWGEEYLPATDREKTLAHAFIDAGAAIVIGSHPHVVQSQENYNGKYIYYSLGNLIFDQYWMDAVDHGLMVQVVFEQNGVVSAKNIPVALGHDRRTCPM